MPIAPGGVVQLDLLGGWALTIDGNLSRGDQVAVRPSLDQTRDAGRVGVELRRDAQRLVALLALRGRMPRTLVAGRLWPSEADDVAASRLRAQLWRLRYPGRGVASLVEVSDVSVALHPVVAVDVDRFKAAARHLIRGIEEPDAVGIVLDGAELLPGWNDDWVLAAREQVWYLRLSALCALAARRHAQHRHREARQAALAAIGSEPLHEAAYRILARVDVVEGNVVDAVRRYERFGVLLGRELGRRPSAYFTGLMQPYLGTAPRASPPG